MRNKTTLGYEQVILYYFSGTGNAKQAAIWFKTIAESSNIECSLFDISKNESPQIPTNKKILIGFFSPTHGFNFPPIMLKFLANFPKSKKQDVFFVNTRAGMKLSKLFLPGLSGATQFFSAILMKLKGFNVVGMQPLDMPSNWISVHPGLRAKVILSIADRCQKIIEKFANQILAGKKRYKALWSLPIDIAILPITVLYYLVGRFALAKTFYTTNNCTNCGLCLQKCPVQAISKVNGRMFWTYNCESCMKCISICPKSSIQVSHAYTISLWFVIIGIVSPLINRLFFDVRLLNLSTEVFLFALLEYISEMLISITIVIIMYRVFHFFLRFTFFNKLMEYTSLTKYWRGYNLEKTLKNKEVLH